METDREVHDMETEVRDKTVLGVSADPIEMPFGVDWCELKEPDINVGRIHLLPYDTIRYSIFTCAQKLTRWPA